MSIYLLTTSILSGILSLSILFALCFLAVHVTKLAKLGAKYQKQSRNKPTADNKPAPKQEQPSPPKTAEPVYYIVERKRKVKSGFGEPKQIRFK